MKKVLFVLGFAVCATFAMAQTNKVAPKPVAPQKAAALAATAQQPVDYKASIFTKDDDVIVHTFTFAPSDTAGMLWGSAAKVVTGDTIDGQRILPVNAHGRSEHDSYWWRVDNRDSVSGTGFATEYSDLLNHYVGPNWIKRYMGSDNGIEDDNGFMFISLAQYPTGGPSWNSYFRLPAVALPANTPLIDIQWRQGYIKYYDECYLDYMLNGHWYSLEVNVTGVDVEVNGVGPAGYIATLPPAAAAQDSLQIRFRSHADGSIFYGYCWAVDNVSIVIPAATARWSFNSEGFLDGFYGTLPQGFNIPLSYVLYGRNRGADNLTGVTMGVNHLYNGAVDTLLTRAQNPMPAGDPGQNYLLKFNERGFMRADLGFDSETAFDQAYPPSGYEYYGTDDDVLAAAGYGRIGLSTTNAGFNQFVVNIRNEQGLNRSLDTIGYTVSQMLEADDDMGIIEGYRWSHDNGVIPGQSEFAYHFTGGDRPGFVSDDPEEGHQYESNYEIYVRYNTPNVIPTDRNGDPWVFRGIEYVTATTLTSNDVVNARITPLCCFWSMNDTGGTVWYYLNTGLESDEEVLVPATAAPSEAVDLFGYYTPDAPYYAFDVLFPNQPAIMPNMTYVFGYTKADNTPFAVAKNQTSFAVNADSTGYYRSTPELAPYANQFWPTSKVYDVVAYDPIQGARSNADNHTIAGWNIDEYPMVRLIVGPKMDIPQHEVFLDCPDEEGEYWVYRSGYNYCDFHDTVAEGSSVTYYFFPGSEEEMSDWNDVEAGQYFTTNGDDNYGHMVIDAIYDNGNPVNINDTNVVFINSYDVYWEGHTPNDGQEEWAPAMVRNYYGYTVRSIQTDHVLTAHASYQELSIGEVEDYINLSLAPNPATSQVAVRVAGFTGKANCSILDMSGRVVYSTDITAGESVLSLNGIPAGAYFVRVTNNVFSKVEKLIVR